MRAEAWMADDFTEVQKRLNPSRDKYFVIK